MENTNTEKIKISHKDVVKYTRILLYLIVAGLIRSFSLKLFIVPNGLAPGGVSGISSILYNANPEFFNLGLTILILNIPLFILGFLNLGRKFILLTIFETISSTIILDVVWLLPPFADIAPITSDIFLAAVVGGVLGGIAVGIVLRSGGSSGGSDIIGLLIQKKTNSSNIAWILFILDAVVICAGGIYFKNLTMVLYSYIALFVSSKVNETILSGFNSAIAVYVITNKKEDVSNAVFTAIRRGVTAVKAQGVYTGSEKDMLVCIVRKRQFGTFKNIIKQVDSDAFVFSTMAKEVIGQGFTS